MDFNNNMDGFCYICRRPASEDRKMVQLPGNLCVCEECLQKTTESMNRFFGNVGFNQDFREVVENGQESVENNRESAEDHEEPVGTGQEAAEGQTVAAEEKKGEDKKGPEGKHPNISFINLSDLGNLGFGNPFAGRQKVKQKEKKPKEKPVFSIDHIPAPHKIKEKLDEYVIGQEQAKKIMSVAVYNHYKRVATDTMDSIEIEKSNILMIGPTGSGKTYLVKTLARLLDVPLAIADATSLTEAGYIGDDIESVLSKLLAAADNDVDRAEKGIVFIDEIDKIARKKDTTTRDVNGESVQQGMLKLLEGADVDVPVGTNSKNPMVPMVTMNTRNILFVCGGAFPDLDTIIKQRLNKQTSIGYNADLKDKYNKEKNLLKQVRTEDIKKYGMIPEFIGRLPVLCTLDPLSEDMLVQILQEPKNAILKQYQKLLELDEVKLRFDEGALHAIAQKAAERDTGARALRAIIEEFMLDIMYEVPKDENIGTVTITEEYVKGAGSPRIEMRGLPLIEDKDKTTTE